MVEFGDLFKTVAIKASEPVEKIRTDYSDSISKEIDEYLSNIKDDGSHRSPGFHASGLYDICDRKLLLQALTGKEDKNEIDSELRMKFMFGTAIHSFLQDDLLGPAGLIIGEWRCAKCGTQADGSFIVRPTVACKNCNATWYSYIEPKMRIIVPNVPNDPEWNIVGSCDGITKEKKILDIKTISPSSAANLDAAWTRLKKEKKSIDWSIPNDSLNWADKAARKYYVQIQLYIYGFDMDSGFIYYVPKDKVDSIKDWIQISVERDDQVISWVFKKIQRIYAEAAKIKAKEPFKLLKRICASTHSFRARDCSVCTECFNSPEE